MATHVARMVYPNDIGQTARGLRHTKSTIFMKSKTTAYLLWLPCMIGLCGLHHFYLGKTLKGLLWLFTLGLMGIGQFIDLFTLGSQVAFHNQGLQLDTLRTTSMQQMARSESEAQARISGTSSQSSSQSSNADSDETT